MLFGYKKFKESEVKQLAIETQLKHGWDIYKPGFNMPTISYKDKRAPIKVLSEIALLDKAVVNLGGVSIKFRKGDFGDISIQVTEDIEDVEDLENHLDYFKNIEGLSEDSYASLRHDGVYVNISLFVDLIKKGWIDNKTSKKIIKLLESIVNVKLGV